MSPRTSIVQRMWDSLLRHKWLFLLAVLTVSGTAIALLSTRAHTYEATALTQVSTEDVESELGVTPAQTVTTPSQENVDHFTDLVNDNLPGGFLDLALRHANLAKPINVDPKAADPRYAVLKKRLLAAIQSDSVWTITLTWDNPNECERIVSALQQQYIEEVGQNRAAQAVATGNFLDSQIADYEGRMRKAEQALIDYKRQNSGELPESQSADISQLSNLKAELDNLQITAHDNDLKKAEIEKRMAQIKPLSILEQTSSESPYESQIKSLMAKRDTLLASGKLPAHPDVVALNDQITYLQKSLADKVKAHSPEASNITQTKLQDNPEYQALQQQYTDASISGQTQQAQVQHLQEAIAQYETRIQRIPSEQRELTDKTRDYSILKAQYESLLSRREQVKVKGDLDKVSASSLQIPLGQIYAEPTMGHTKLLILMAASVVLGIIVGIILIVLSEWSDQSLRYEADTERLLGVPVLALLPETAELRFKTALPGAASRAGTGRSEPMTFPAKPNKEPIMPEDDLTDTAPMPPLTLWPERTLRPDETTAAALREIDAHGVSQPTILPPDVEMPDTEDRTLPPDEFAALMETQDAPPAPPPGAAPPSSTPAISLRVEKTPTEFSHLYAALERQAAGIGDVTLLSSETLGSASPYVLGVTSAVAGEGKTTVALHLAMTVARDTFKRVCLLDMSLGGSDLGARLGVPATGEGVVAVLEDSGTVVPTLQLAGCDNLVIIPAGKTPLNPAKLARSPRVEQLIVSARFAFDVIIIDLPPVSSDNALPLARAVDGLLMVVRAGATPQDVVSRALDMLGREKVLGVTLNRVPPSKKPKGWGRKK